MDVPAAVLPSLKCSRCETYLSRGPVFRGEDGWRCERCAPTRCACENQAQGCTHSDIDKKCWKHEFFFCQQRTTCVICGEKVSRGSLSAHYDSAHKDVTYRAGSTWRARRPDSHGEYCLVSSVAGVTMCKYWLDASSFVLRVYIPVSSERLSEFRCAVRLTHRDTGHTHTYTPDVCYTRGCDWRIEVKSGEFPSWRGEFDVCVDITRADAE